MVFSPASGAKEDAGGQSGHPAKSGSATIRFGSSTVRAYGESVGICPLNEDVCEALTEELMYRLGSVVQDATKFVFHSKRRKMFARDVASALKLQGHSPVFGVTLGPDMLPLRHAHGGGRHLHFGDEKIIELRDVQNAPMPRIPAGLSLRAHWLAIDGIQPSVPENPPSQSVAHIKLEQSDPVSTLSDVDAKENKQICLSKFKPNAKRDEEIAVSMRQLANHELSVEQQVYYKEITDACVGSDESKRAEALGSLASDPGLHQMLPRLCLFISEGVRINVVQRNLAILIYLMRMVKSLLENQSLFLEKYLHDLVPAIGSCVVSRHLCNRPDLDNHFALRDFAARLLATISKTFDSPTNGLQTRITRMFSDSLESAASSMQPVGAAVRGPIAPLVAFYGPLTGLQELGPRVIKLFVIPQIQLLSRRLDMIEELANADPPVLDIASERYGVSFLRRLFSRSINPVIKAERLAAMMPDTQEYYIRDYGITMGTFIHSEIGSSGTEPAVAASTQQIQIQMGPNHGTQNVQRLFVVQQK